VKDRCYSNSSTIGSAGTAAPSNCPTPETQPKTTPNDSLTVKIVGSSADSDGKKSAEGPCIWHLDVFFGIEDEKNAVHAKRRYRQFLALNEDLKSNNIKITSRFPPKYCILSTPTEEQLERRRKGLSIWLEEAIHKSFGRTIFLFTYIILSSKVSKSPNDCVTSEVKSFKFACLLKNRSESVDIGD
jgi:hypothetical protein